MAFETIAIKKMKQEETPDNVGEIDKGIHQLLKNQSQQNTSQYFRSY